MIKIIYFDKRELLVRREIKTRLNWTFGPLNNYEFTFWSHKL